MSLFQDSRAESLVDFVDRLIESLTIDPVPNGNSPVDRLVCEARLYERIATINTVQRTIRRYQRRRGISGLSWNHLQFCGYAVDAPYLHDGLSPTRNDVRQLYLSKDDILAFCDRISPYFQVWSWDQVASQEGQYPWQRSTWETQRQILASAQWLTLHYVDRIQRSPVGGEMPVHYFWIEAHFSPPTRLDDDFFPVVLNNSPPTTIDLTA